MQQGINMFYVLNAVIFSMLGLAILVIAFFVFDKLTPGDLWKEICEKHNIALAIVVGSMTMAIAQIIASAIHG
jgi:putative membrane protein